MSIWTILVCSYTQYIDSGIEILSLKNTKRETMTSISILLSIWPYTRKPNGPLIRANQVYCQLYWMNYGGIQATHRNYKWDVFETHARHSFNRAIVLERRHGPITTTPQNFDGTKKAGNGGNETKAVALHLFQRFQTPGRVAIMCLWITCLFLFAWLHTLALLALQLPALAGRMEV
jgi:hypothetical protein